MNEVKGLVSIIIPAYNAMAFLGETLESIRKQTYTSWEVILVNDGSTDGIEEWLQKQMLPELKIITQKNAGVSVARNNGLQKACGEFVVFLDADDLLTPGFLQGRIQVLSNEPDVDFVGGLARFFPGKEIVKKAAAENPAENIYFFNSEFVTIPSNYMYRRNILIRHGVVFNPQLSSTADRFYLLEIARFAKGKCLEDEDSAVLYRISENSMSNKLTRKLMDDNAKFFTQLVEKNLLPLKRRASFKGLYFLSLAFGFAKVKAYDQFLNYTVRSFISSPTLFVKNIFKKMIGQSIAA